MTYDDLWKIIQNHLNGLTLISSIRPTVRPLMVCQFFNARFNERNKRERVVSVIMKANTLVVIIKIVFFWIFHVNPVPHRSSGISFLSPNQQCRSTVVTTLKL